MNKEIYQFYQKMNCDDVLKKKFYPVWFFGNERINKILTTLIDEKAPKKNITKIFSVGGSGDFAFSVLSTIKEIKEIITCDIRPMAPPTIDIKKALFLEFSLEEILKLFSSPGFNKEKIYRKILGKISRESKIILDNVLNNCKQGDFLKCIKKSGFWYKDSFWQIKDKNAYLLYLTDQEKYQQLKNNLEKISIYYGDFNGNLKLFKSGYFDLIYVSNIFDSKNYCQNISLYMQTIKEKLAEGGYLFVVTQNSPKKIIKLLEEKFAFRIHLKELRRFNIITSLLGHYSYSFLIFKNVMA